MDCFTKYFIIWYWKKTKKIKKEVISYINIKALIKNGQLYKKGYDVIQNQSMELMYNERVSKFGSKKIKIMLNEKQKANALQWDIMKIILYISKNYIILLFLKMIFILWNLYEFNLYNLKGEP